MTTLHFAFMVAFITAGSFVWQIKKPALVYLMTGFALIIALHAIIGNA